MTDVTVDTAAARLRGILEAESAARLALKRAKADAFLAAVEAGEKITVAWQLIATNEGIQRLEDEYERAHIALIVENALSRLGLQVAYIDGEDQ